MTSRSTLKRTSRNMTSQKSNNAYQTVGMRNMKDKYNGGYVRSVIQTNTSLAFRLAASYPHFSNVYPLVTTKH